MNRPLLFLDVDGPLNPYAAQPERRPHVYTTLRVPRNDAHEDDRGFSSRRRASGFGRPALTSGFVWLKVDLLIDWGGKHDT
ncbi:hypothetical protein GCM10010230_23460 [Streptomyces narbonensis]|nr:hypothetical protein GCM10010230_23460 [Streptomyces narbonensis]